MYEVIPQDQPNNMDAQAIGAFPYQQEQPQPVQQSPSQSEIMAKLNAMFTMRNIADTLDASLLAEIGRRVVEDYEHDKESRADWEREQEEISKVSSLSTEQKFWAGKVVSNVKYPLIMQAAIHYASRAYPEIVKSNSVVKCAVVGKDPDGRKEMRARRVGSHMSYQLLEEMDWERELDQLLMTYAITGCEFKKTYYCPIRELNVSDIVFAKDLVVDYFTKDIKTAQRITHVIMLTKNDIAERIAAKVFRKDLTLESFGQAEQDLDDNNKYKASGYDEDAPHKFLEQHRFWDLDGDGYEEPYIVTVHKQSNTVVRICARYDLDGIKLAEDGSIKRIEPVEYFTPFIFMPAPDGSFYGMGLGKLLFGLNNAINSAINQLIDAGTANNRQSGFLGRGVQLGRSSAGTDGFALGAGEWKSVPSTGDDLRKNIIPMPTKEPSQTLYTLMTFLTETGKEVASMADILSGETPGSNVPATSTLALIEQGLKVFNGTFKRLYRSLKSEFKKLYRLNKMYLTEEKYFTVLDDVMAISSQDYEDTSLDIIPVADPNNISDMSRSLKIQAMMQLATQGFNLDRNELVMRYLTALDIESPENLIAKEAPPPDPVDTAKAEKLSAEAERIKKETVSEAVKAMYAAIQTANVAATVPQTSNIADAILLSAGFEDANGPPAIPESNMAQIPNMQQPQIPQNTHPMYPSNPDVGMERGIETQANDGQMATMEMPPR